MNKKYYTIVSFDYQSIKQVESIEGIDLKNVKYVVESVWIKDTYSKKNSLYKHLVKNNLMQDNVGNVMVLESVNCWIDEQETWDVVINPNHKAVCLKVKINDKLGLEKVIHFDNSEHSDVFFKELFFYVEKLNKYGTHIAIEDINRRDKTIIRLQSKIPDSQK